MKILAHRGYWNGEIPNNSPTAIRGALEQGYGFESDIRDYEGKLVISHNIADPNSQAASEIFRWLAEYQNEFCFAINIKADGLGQLLLRELGKNGITNYFTFDMSVPQMIEYANSGLTYFTRQSEVEPDPVMYEGAAGVWIDGFFGNSWITEEMLRKHLANGKRICVVSPELHGREHTDFWKRLNQFDIDFELLLLCTDYPDEAAHIFKKHLN